MSSRFEFLGNTMVGQYIPRQSWFHQRDPRARLLALSMLLIGVIFSAGVWGLGLGFLGVLGVYAISKLPFKPAWESIRRAMPFILILAVLQLLFSFRSESSPILLTIWGLSITREALNSAAMLILRFLVLITLINALVMSISTSQISAALFYLLKPLEKIGFPINDVTMVVQITMRYIPMIAQMAEKTAKAQAARGGDWEQRGFNPIRQAKRVLPLIVPLMINSLHRAETMALAMESRGFNAAKQRSSFYALTFGGMDWLLLLVALVLTVFTILI